MNQIVDPVPTHLPKVFIVCDQSDTAPVWSYILRQQGLIVDLITSVETAMHRWITEVPDLVVIDIDLTRRSPIEVCKEFRKSSIAPVLLFLPTHHETQILEAYAAGVDEVVVKPISPAIFLAKIRAWVRRSWTIPVEELSVVKAGRYRLDLAGRCLINPGKREISLTNLEFRLLLLLMSRPGYVFKVEDIVQSVWTEYGKGDQTLLKNVVYRLRKKIEADPSRPTLIQTGPAGGYSFQG